MRKQVKIGLLDIDSHNYPNLPLMKISAWHKAQGNQVEFVFPLNQYDRVYVSKVFGDEYSKMPPLYVQADKIIYGGTGFAITVENGKEVYRKARDPNLPYEIEHTYPDYGLYPKLTKDKAFGFLTRGCCNDCGFCIVSEKEGRCSQKVADLSEFWRGQREISLLDANLLSCKEKLDLIRQLADSHALVDFTQGLDARFINDDVAAALKDVRIKRAHFAFDFMKNENAKVRGLHTFHKYNPRSDHDSVYILTNYNTTTEEDLYRVRKVEEAGYIPDIRIYRKQTALQILKDLQRWANNRIIYRSCKFMDYVPRKDGKTIKQLYFK